MKGDFARVTFDRTRHYSQVFQQQGRVLLEADWNEQGALTLHLLRALAYDLMGPCWAAGGGFGIDSKDLKNPAKIAPAQEWRLAPGHFYVDGILCENDKICTLAGQPYAPTFDYNPAEGTSGFEHPDAPYVLWLDVWERHLSSVEAPSNKDPALNGVDTASRAQVIWQVRAWTEETAKAWLNDIDAALEARKDVPQSPEAEATAKLITEIGKVLKDLHASFGKVGGPPPPANAPPDDTCERLRWCLGARARFVFPQLRAQVKPAESDQDPCVIAADARYRGCENQLYRVEIHDRGLAGAGATFKWSRENGSVIFPIVEPVAPGEAAKDGSTQMTVELADFGRDQRLALSVGDWVELIDDDYTLAGRAFSLLQIAALDPARPIVTLSVPKNVTPYLPSSGRHPLLRRWDETIDLTAQGVVEVAEGTAIDLEDGIQIAFEPGGLYATGDYWVIPARVAGNGSLDWPLDPNAPNPDFAGVARKASGMHHVSVLGGADADGVYRECCCRHVPLCLQHAAEFDPLPGMLIPATKHVAPAPASRKAKPARSRRGGK